MSSEERNQDLQDLREAVDKFMVKYNDKDDNTLQIGRVIDMLRDLKVEGVLKSEQDYADYLYTSEEYYDSGNW